MGQNPTEWRRDDEFNFPDGSTWHVEDVQVSIDKKRVVIEFISNDREAQPVEDKSEKEPERFCETTVPDEWLNDV